MSVANPIVAVIDDDDSVRRALQRLLRSVGWAVASFASGKDFLDALPSNPIDCIILDLQMPGLSGLEVLTRLACMNSRTPVIILTGHDSVAAREQAGQAGAAKFLCKPVDDRELLDSIQQAIAPAS